MNPVFVVIIGAAVASACTSYLSCGTCVINNCVFVQDMNKEFYCLSWHNLETTKIRRTFRTLSRCEQHYKLQKQAFTAPTIAPPNPNLTQVMENPPTTGLPVILVHTGYSSILPPKSQNSTPFPHQVTSFTELTTTENFEITTEYKQYEKAQTTVTPLWIMTTEKPSIPRELTESLSTKIPEVVIENPHPNITIPPKNGGLEKCKTSSKTSKKKTLDSRLEAKLRQALRRFRLRKLPLTERVIRREINRILCRLAYLFLAYNQTWNLGSGYVRMQINNPLMTKSGISPICSRYKNLRM